MSLRVCAVSYLNTAPLVWGMLHGPQRGLFDLLFRLPSECADMVAAGEADIGIIPTFELAAHDFGTVPGIGIACRGAVRSILMVSRVPPTRIATLAADTSSRTSVALARLVLEQGYGAAPAITPHPPDLEAMLAANDAALLIGDAALRLDPDRLPYAVYDLGAEWQALTGLPMVFAVWAGRRECLTDGVVGAFQGSCRFGLENLEALIAVEAPRRGFPIKFARHYLTSHVVYELGEREYAGLELFLRYAAATPPLTLPAALRRVEC